jgi:hypothetical protein
VTVDAATAAESARYGRRSGFPPAVGPNIFGPEIVKGK